MTIQITDPIYGPYYTKSTLSSFLENNNLSKGLSGKKKDEILDIINENIENDKISSNNLIEWQKKLLHEGKKHIVYFKYSVAEEVNYETCINEMSLEFNDTFFDSENNDDFIELYFNDEFLYVPNDGIEYETEQHKNFITVIKIEKNKQTYSISFLPPTDLFVWSAENEGLISVTSTYLIKYYKEIINNTFNLTTYSNKLEYINVLSHIWTITNDAILNELSPLTANLSIANQQYVDSCVGSIFNYNFASTNFGTLYDIKEENYNTMQVDRIKDEILNKLKTTWISFFINESKIPFEFRNQYGIIITESLQTQDGMKMKCGSKSVPLYNYKIHNDIIGNSMSEAHECDEMMFEWFYNDKRIKTSLKCYSDYFYILFHRTALKEEIDYVLSTIESIKNQIQSTR